MTESPSRIAKHPPGTPLSPHSRTFFRRLARLASRALLRLSVTGIENVPLSGGVLLAMNHLGGADVAVVVGFAPRPVEVIGKSEIMNWPMLGRLAQAYGMIPVRRGEPDRETLTAALAVLQAGRALLIAPEGRESLTGALEAAKGGAAFLAVQAQAPIVPIAITGTAWTKVLAHWRRFRRPRVTLTFGPPFTLPPGVRRREAADLIMRRIAVLLPEEYRGAYIDQV